MPVDRDRVPEVEGVRRARQQDRLSCSQPMMCSRKTLTSLESPIVMTSLNGNTLAETIAESRVIGRTKLSVLPPANR